MLRAALLLEGAVTWQPGDHVSKFVVWMCWLFLRCVCVCMCVWLFQAMFEDNVLFQLNTASPSNSYTQLRPERWQAKSASPGDGLSLHPSHPCVCSLFLQGGCLSYASLPWGWRPCNWMIGACMSVESSYWINQEMSCKTAPGLCFL